MGAVKLAFEEFGDTHQPPLIIVHGFFASARNWRQVAVKLALNFHVYVLDMRNHGASPHHAIMDYPAMAADLRAFMSQHGLKTTHLLGHSMGGKVAIWFALNNADCVDKLVVVDIAPVSYQHSFDGLITALKSLPLHDISNRKHAELLLANAIPDLSYRQFLLQNLILTEAGYGWRIDLDIFYRTAANIVEFPAIEQRLYHGKTLFIAGANSDYVNADAIRPLFSHAELSVIADAGHWLHVQQPVAFIDKVSAFLTSH
jgi:pimeloyl-ACP methyl ester carboxylesterase